MRRACSRPWRRWGEHDWFVGRSPTVADLALFAYTHRADGGEFDLARLPGVVSWISRAEALPGSTPLPRTGEAMRQR